MGCCSCEDKSEEVKDCAFVEDEERGCSDILWLIGFFAACAAFVFCYTSALGMGGDTDLVLKGVDFNGEVCPNLAAWPSLLSYDVKICVDSCSETLDNPDGLMIFPYETEEYIYYCLPAELDDLVLSYNFTSFEYYSDFSTAVADIYTVSWLIFASFAVALAACFLFVKCAGEVGLCFVILMSALAIAFGLACGYFVMDEASTQEDPDTADLMEIGAYVIWGLTAILALVLCALRKKIMLAVKVVKAAGDAMTDMPLLLAFPLVPFVIAIGYFMLWCYVAVILASVVVSEQVAMPDEFTQSVAGVPVFPAWDGVDSYTHLTWDSDTMEPYFGYVFFHLLWVIQFLKYFNYLVAAGAVAKWYFTKFDEETGNKELEAGIITGSCKRACRFHLGSIALGSFIIAVIQFIRACIKYIEEKTKDQQNDFTKCMFKCIQCCLKCVECCLDKLAQNGYAYIAIKGGNFCGGACSAFALLLANMGRTAAIVWVEGCILFLGKVFVAGSTAAFAAAVINYAYTSVDSIVIPTVLVFILALAVAQFFMVEYDVCIDTIFLSLLIDEKCNNGAPKYGTKELKGMFDSAAADITKEMEAQGVNKKDGPEATEMDEQSKPESE